MPFQIHYTTSKNHRNRLLHILQRSRDLQRELYPNQIVVQVPVNETMHEILPDEMLEGRGSYTGRQAQFWQLENKLRLLDGVEDSPLELVDTDIRDTPVTRLILAPAHMASEIRRICVEHWREKVEEHLAKLHSTATN